MHGDVQYRQTAGAAAAAVAPGILHNELLGNQEEAVVKFLHIRYRQLIASSNEHMRAKHAVQP